MNYAQLGNTELLVSRLCLGTMTFGDGSGVYEHIGNLDPAYRVQRTLEWSEDRVDQRPPAGEHVRM